MSRSLALLLLLGAACLAASAAGAGEKVVPAATKAPAATKQAPAAAAKTPVAGNKQAQAKLADAKKSAKKAKVVDEGPLANANCTAQLCIGDQSCEDLDWFNPVHVEREKTAHIPGILDNAYGNKGLTMSGDPPSIKMGVVFHDHNQVMAVTVKLTPNKISAHYMLNSYMPKVTLSDAKIILTCDAFKDIAGVRPDYDKHSFPTHITTDFTKDAVNGTLTIELDGMTTHHCANFKASWYVAECDEGECCHIESGRHFDEHTRCRHSHNPCIKDQYCTGHHHECPEETYEEEGTHCAWSGQYADYYTLHAEGFKHTRIPAGSAVSIASTKAAMPSFSDMDECGGKCDGAGNCNLNVEEATCCKEVLKYGAQYGYGAISKPSYGYDGEKGDDGYGSNKGDGYDDKGDGYGGKGGGGSGYGKDKGDGYGSDKGDGYGHKGDSYGSSKGDGYDDKGDSYGSGKGDYGSKGNRKAKYDYDVYTAADKSSKASVQQATQTGKASTQSETDHIPLIHCFEGEY